MVIETKGLSKQFGTFYALRDIDFSIKEGEIHGLVGENGAGKSTLIKILSGVYEKSGGEIFVSGENVSISSPAESRKLGISVIHQERNLVPSFSGAENIYLGMDTPKKHGMSIDFRKMKKNIEAVMKRYGIEIPLDKMAKELTPSEKTMLEIIRAVMNNSKLLILDEPTASLTDKETSKLFSLIRRINSEGSAILYVSHRLEEIFELTSSITVFKNGQTVDTVRTDEIDQNSLIAMMTDNWMSGKCDDNVCSKGTREVFSAKHLSTLDGIVKDVSFSVHQGEIMGLFGLGGAGRTECLEAVFGLRRIKGGTIAYDDKVLSHITPAKCLRDGIVLVHEDRRGHSLVVSRSVRDNIMLSSIDGYLRHGMYDVKKEKEDAENVIKAMNILSQGQDQAAGELSGGNQQKVVFARAMMTSPRLFLCDEPTQAVDVKTREEIHELLRSAAGSGSAVVYVTSDLKEMLEIADSITIISHGRTFERLDNKNLTSQEVLRYCYKER